MLLSVGCHGFIVAFNSAAAFGFILPPDVDYLLSRFFTLVSI